MMKKFLPLLFISSSFALFAMKKVSVPYTHPFFAIEFFPFLAFSAVAVFSYWFVVLRSSIPLVLTSSKPPSYKLFWILFIFCLVNLSITLLTAETLNFSYLLILIGVGVAVGINEEFIFRVAGYRNFLVGGKSQKRAVLLSAAFFSSFHLLNIGAGVGYSVILQLINTFMMGCVLAFLFFQTRSIWYPVVIHGLWDLAALSNSMFGNDSIKGVVSLSSLICGILAFVWFLTRLNELEAPIIS